MQLFKREEARARVCVCVRACAFVRVGVRARAHVCVLQDLWVSQGTDRQLRTFG